jgi:hypothetical protein
MSANVKYKRYVFERDMRIEFVLGRDLQSEQYFRQYPLFYKTRYVYRGFNKAITRHNYQKYKGGHFFMCKNIAS